MLDQFEQAVAHRLLILPDAGARSPAYHAGTRAVNRRRKAHARLARALDAQVAAAATRERAALHQSGDHSRCRVNECLARRWGADR